MHTRCTRRLTIRLGQCAIGGPTISRRHVHWQPGLAESRGLDATATHRRIKGPGAELQAWHPGSAARAAILNVTHSGRAPRNFSINKDQGTIQPARDHQFRFGRHPTAANLSVHVFCPTRSTVIRGDLSVRDKLDLSRRRRRPVNHELPRDSDPVISGFRTRSRNL